MRCWATSSLVGSGVRSECKFASGLECGFGCKFGGDFGGDFGGVASQPRHIYTAVSDQPLSDSLDRPSCIFFAIRVAICLARIAKGP